MNPVYLFPGQGAQHPGMGRDLHDAFPEARSVFERADEILGFSLSTVMFDAPEDAPPLSRTDITQPALFVHSMAALAVLYARGRRPAAAAGHSLGEYSAVTAAGVLSFEDGLEAVRVRGELMAQANERSPGAMTAVIGLEDNQVEAACRAAADETGEVAVPANYNAPGQLVISGAPVAVARAGELASDAGARRVIPLDVGGAFHSPLMAFAREGLAENLAGLDFRSPECPVVLNVTARPCSDPVEIRDTLLEQLLSPVRWSQSLTTLATDGHASFLEVGTGKVLSGLVRRTLGRDVVVAQAGVAEDFERLEPAS